MFAFEKGAYTDRLYRAFKQDGADERRAIQILPDSATYTRPRPHCGDDAPPPLAKRRQTVDIKNELGAERASACAMLGKPADNV